MQCCLFLILLGLLPSIAQAQNPRIFKATLTGYEEVPAISTNGTGTFTLTIDLNDSGFNYELNFSGTTGTVTQSHTHIAQKGVNGGIMIFFCSNLGNGPAGTQACPTSGTVTGRITAADVIGGAAAQGVSPGEFAKVLAAIKAGSAYVNVHSTTFPGGEIRGQLLPDMKIKN